MTARREKVVMALIGLVAGAVPAILTHLNAREEIRLKYQRANQVTERAYDELAGNVSAMADEIERQHDLITRLDAQLEVLAGTRSPADVPPPVRPPVRLQPRFPSGPAMGVAEAPGEPALARPEPWSAVQQKR